MADNITVDNGGLTDYTAASDEVTYSGDTAEVQLVRIVETAGTEGSKTVVPLTTGQQYIEDTAISANLGQGTLVVARRDDALSTLTPAEDDAVGLRANSLGALWVAPDGGIAHDAADAGNPIKIGGKARTAVPTAVTANDRVDGLFGSSGQFMATSIETTVAAGDAVGAFVRGQLTLAGNTTVPDNVAPLVFNGTTSDRLRSAGVTGMVGVGGATASDSPVAANPVTTGARASTAVPTAVGADGDVVNTWANRNGAPVQTQAPHVGLNSDPWNLVHEGVRYTSAQTSAVVVAGGASEKIVVTKVQLQTEGTTAGTAILYFGTGAFSRGTNRACFDGNFIPSATSAPGVVMDGPFISGTNGDDLLFTSVGNLTIVVNVWYYVVT